jgi:glutamate synthase (NADPH/NADH) small chain
MFGGAVMASTCPKCHQIIENDSVCCADIKYTWKCKSCGKLSTGFVVPYGRCFLCGGENELIEGYAGARPELVAIVQEAVQFEIDTYHFYRMAAQHTKNEVLRSILEELSHKEQDHLKLLEEKYHLHFGQDLRQLSEEDEKIVFGFIFHGIDFKNAEDHPLQVYNKAIAMEHRTRNRFLTHAKALPPGPQRELYRELAAEEEDHINILETEREQFLKK